MSQNILTKAVTSEAPDYIDKTNRRWTSCCPTTLPKMGGFWMNRTARVALHPYMRNVRGMPQLA